ncbi:UNVERIFIED_CONTAM: hypothetical protein GTU68_059372 [Idotea baltica]|nr:hypothetical protein [Idotea baltica]
MNDVLTELTKILEQRKNASDENSYVASLHEKGLNKILEKVGEEATETILAAKDAGNDKNAGEALIKETADLWFHTLVMLSHLNMSAQDVLAELESRFGLSGLEEKAARSKH